MTKQEFMNVPVAPTDNAIGERASYEEGIRRAPSAYEPSGPGSIGSGTMGFALKPAEVPVGQAPCHSCGHLKTIGQDCTICWKMRSDPLFIPPALPQLTYVEDPVGRKDDAGKPRYDLLPARALRAVAEVLDYGAKKYAPDNWRKVKGWRWRYTRAGLGHLFSYASGERCDEESKLPHLAHAACCVLFLLELEAGAAPNGNDQ